MLNLIQIPNEAIYISNNLIISQTKILSATAFLISKITSLKNTKNGIKFIDEFNPARKIERV